MYPTEKEKDILYTVTGQWTKTFEIREGSSKHGALVDQYDAEATPTTPLIVAPIEEQDPMESRRAWLKVAEGIAKGDMDYTGAEKTKIEVAQRELRLQEKAEGRVWQRRYFNCVDSDPVLNQLAPVIQLSPEPDKTGGIWRFDSKKAEVVKSKNKAVVTQAGELK